MSSASYDLNPVAVRLNFLDMPFEELEAFRRRYVECIPSRVQMLAAVIRKDETYRSWKPDHSLQSLSAAGDWLQAHTSGRPLTSTEKGILESTLPSFVTIPDDDLTDQTVSFAVDVSMYFATCFLARYSQLEWVIIRNRRSHDYGQPVLMGCWKKVPLNPVQICLNLAYAALRGERTAGRLGQVFRFWADDADRIGDCRNSGTLQ